MPRQGSSGELPPSVRGVAPGTVLSWQPRPQEFLARRQKRPQVPSRRLSLCDLAQSPMHYGCLQFFCVNYLPSLAASPEASLPALLPPSSLPSLPPRVSTFWFLQPSFSLSKKSPRLGPKGSQGKQLSLSLSFSGCYEPGPPATLGSERTLASSSLTLVIPVLVASRTADQTPHGNVGVCGLCIVSEH